MADTGHVPTHVPHSTQASASTFAFPPSTEIAETGQAPTHDSQPTHTLSSTTAFAIVFSSHRLILFVIVCLEAPQLLNATNYITVFVKNPLFDRTTFHSDMNTRHLNASQSHALPPAEI